MKFILKRASGSRVMSCEAFGMSDMWEKFISMRQSVFCAELFPVGWFITFKGKTIWTSTSDPANNYPDPHPEIPA